MALFEFGLACIVLIIVVVVILLVFVLVLKFVFEFFPSLLIAGLVWWFTQDLFLTLVAFIASAIIFAIIGQSRRRGPRMA